MNNKLRFALVLIAACVVSALIALGSIWVAQKLYGNSKCVVVRCVEVIN